MTMRSICHNSIFCVLLSALAAQTLSARTHLSKTELELWTSPSFQKRFAESYLAVTEVEPTVTQSEREKMLDVLELIQADKLDEAAKVLGKYTKPASSAVFDFTLANIYFQQEQLDLALTSYKAAVEKFPNFRRAWKNIGLIHIRKEEPAEALPALTRSIELGARDALTYGLLGKAYCDVRDYLAAESAYRMAVLLDPGTLDWKKGLAQSLFMQQRYADAAALFETLIASDPENADLWLYQANAYIGLNEPLKAAVNYELVDQMGKSKVESLCMLGDIYVNQELFDIAVDSYIRALEKDRKYARYARVLPGSVPLITVKSGVCFRVSWPMKKPKKMPATKVPDCEENLCSWARIEAETARFQLLSHASKKS